MDRSLQTGVARPDGARETVRTPPAPMPREAVHRIPPRPDAPVITDASGGAVTVPAAQVSDAQLRMILDVSRLLAVPTDLDPLLCRIAEISCQLLNCERASIFLHDIVTGELWTKVAILSNEIRVPSSRGIVGHAFTQNCVVHVPEPYKDARFNPEPDRRTGFVTRNLLTAPMAGVDGKPLGVIQAVNKKLGKGFGDN